MKEMRKLIRGEVANLKELRLKKGITQEQVANEVGIDLENFKKIEEQNSVPVIEEALAIANFFEVNVFKLFSKKKGKIDTRYQVFIHLFVAKVLYINSQCVSKKFLELTFKAKTFY